MSHTTRLPEDWWAHHNGDFSGDIAFYHKVELRTEGFKIPFATVKALVAEYVRGKKITQLEDMEDEELLA